MSVVKQFLADLDSRAMQLAFEDRRKLWRILTALRGPDSDNSTVKRKTTAVIRAMSLPALAIDNYAFVAGHDECSSIPVDINNIIADDINVHFNVHITLAQKALQE